MINLVAITAAAINEEKPSISVKGKPRESSNVFVTRRISSVYTFTRAPMAHKKHSRIQYHFIYFHIKSRAKQSVPQDLIPCSTQSALLYLRH
jgi:hypothetical protein